MNKRIHHDNDDIQQTNQSDLDRKARYQEELIGKLQRSVEYHFKTTKELREQITKLEKEHLEEKSELTKKIEDLEESNFRYLNEVGSLSQQLTELQYQNELLQHQISINHNTTEQNVTSYKNELSSLQQKYDDLLQELQEKNKHIQSNLLTPAETKPSSEDSSLSQLVQLRAQLSQYKSLYEKREKEVESFPAHQLLSDEKIRSLQILLHNYQEKSAQYEQMTCQIHSIESLLRNLNIQINENESPMECMIRHFKEMNRQLVHQTQQENQQQRMDQEQAECIQAQQQKIKDLNNEILNYIRDLSFYKREMETYQGQLHSSQEQIDLMHKMIGQLLAKTRSPSSMEETAANGMEQQQWEQKIVLLEAQIEHLKKENEDYKAASDKANNDVIHTYKVKYEQLEAEKNDLEEQLRSQQKQLSAYESQLSIEQSQYIFDRLNPLTTKVLHLISNPTSDYVNNKCKGLERENQLLKTFINQIKSQSTTKDASSQPQDSSSSINESLATFINPLAQEENQHLKSEIEDLNKRIKRLKDIFGEQMKIFKNTVYRLTGYKIDMTQDQEPKFRIKNMYSGSEEDFLLFSLDSKGELSLLETEMCGKIDSSIFAYIATCHSIPAFLSALTMNLFEKQTIIS